MNCMIVKIESNVTQGGFSNDIRLVNIKLKRVFLSKNSNRNPLKKSKGSQKTKVQIESP